MFKREQQILYRNGQLIGSHVFGDIFMSLLIGSLFFNVHPESFQVRYGLFFISKCCRSIMIVVESPYDIQSWSFSAAGVHISLSGLAEIPVVANVRACCVIVGASIHRFPVSTASCSCVRFVCR